MPTNTRVRSLALKAVLFRGFSDPSRPAIIEARLAGADEILTDAANGVYICPRCEIKHRVRVRGTTT